MNLGRSPGIIDDAGDTAARSLAHWSEAGRREMEAFYEFARLDYEMLVGVLDWRGLLHDLRVAKGSELTLLDVACGSGKFPETLVAHAGLDVLDPLLYDLLDPSTFSLDEAAAALRPPFTEGARFPSTLEDLPAAAGPWDIVWATHALYALEPGKLRAAIARYRAAVGPGGIAFLAQGAADGFYLQVYAAFLEGVRDGTGTPYVASDDIVAELRAQGARLDVRRIAYDHVVAADDTELLTGYLRRCVFDGTVGLTELLEAPVLGPLLASCLDSTSRVYRFHQEVDCVVLTSEQTAVPWRVGS